LITEESLLQAYKAIYAAQNIAVIPHRGPDGDAIGSASAIKLTLQQFGKQVDIVCVDPAPKNSRFLPYSNQIIHQLNHQKYQLIIVVDCGSPEMHKFNLSQIKYPILNIDHHASNTNYGTINLVDETAASTTQILYEIFTKWQFPLNLQIAECLLTGLYFDTGSFKHNNTNPRVLRAASALSKLGADGKKISKNLFHNNSANQLKLWGKILKNAKRTQKNIVTSAVSQKDYQQTQTNSKDLEGVIDYLNTVPESKFSLLLSEDQQGGIKGSIRTQDEGTDLSKIAEVFGGGGHKMASGFRIEGEIKEEKYWSIQ
jgi:phosphoesterase RecJ-like protein